jgi:hypothetical protein
MGYEEPDYDGVLFWRCEAANCLHAFHRFPEGDRRHDAAKKYIALANNFNREVRPMGFIQRELARIEAAVHAEPHGTERFHKLFAAQQALSWALEPDAFAAPLNSIDGAAAASGARGSEGSGARDLSGVPQ